MKPRRASAMIVVLVAVTVVSVIGVELLRAVVMREQSARSLLKRRQAQMLAESALERGLLLQKASPDYKGELWQPATTSSPSSLPRGEGESWEAEIVVEDNLLTVEARVGQGSRRAAYRVQRSIQGESP